MATCEECLGASVVLRVHVDTPGEAVYVPCPECQPFEAAPSVELEELPTVKIHLAKHRAAGPASTIPHPHHFQPRHCAGDGCLHNHAGRSTPLRGVMHLLPSWLRKSVA